MSSNEVGAFPKKRTNINPVRFHPGHCYYIRHSEKFYNEAENVMLILPNLSVCL